MEASVQRERQTQTESPEKTSSHSCAIETLEVDLHQAVHRVARATLGYTNGTGLFQGSHKYAHNTHMYIYAYEHLHHIIHCV